MGDGSFGFTAGELETVARLGAPILMLVLSNGCYGWIKAGQRAGYGARYYSVDFGATDHAAVRRQRAAAGPGPEYEIVDFMFVILVRRGS